MQVQIWSSTLTTQLYAVIINDADDVLKAQVIERHEMSRCLNGVIVDRPGLVAIINHNRVEYTMIDARTYHEGKR